MHVIHMFFIEKEFGESGGFTIKSLKENIIHCCLGELAPLAKM